MTDYPRPTNQIEQFAILIFRINAALIQNGNTIVSDLGQSSARWHILGQVEFQPQTVAMIARNMGQARQSVQRLADVLADEGLVTYSKHPTDGRTKLVKLTNKGRRVVGEINKRNAVWIEQTAHSIDGVELERTNTELEHMAKVIEQNLF